MMGFDNLKKIYQFSEKNADENYWKDLFQHHTFPNWNTANYSSITSSSNFPACDVYSNNHFLVIEIELPGMDLSAISINLQENNTLVISGEYASLHENCAYYIKERQNRHFSKKISIPFPIKEKDMKHHLVNGLLTIQIANH